MKSNRIWLSSLCLLLLTVSLHAALPEIYRVKNPDQVEVIREGDRISAERGMELQEADELVTGPAGRVLIRLPNSDTVQLGSDSRLEVSRYFHDPETSQIQARVELGEGELIGNLNTLKSTPDSHFQIATLVGVAGIRGTQFRILIRRDITTGRLSARFGVASGDVEVELSGLAAAAAETILAELGAEEEIEISGDVDPQSGEVTSIESVTEQPLSQDSRDAIEEAVREIQEETTDDEDQSDDDQSDQSDDDQSDQSDQSDDDQSDQRENLREVAEDFPGADSEQDQTPPAGRESN